MHLHINCSTIYNRQTWEQPKCPSTDKWIKKMWCIYICWASLVAQIVKCLPATRETWVWSLGWEDSPGEGNGNPLQYSCLENPMDGEAWWATVHGVTKSQTWLSNFTSLHIYTCVYIHTHTHTHTYIYIHTHTVGHYSAIKRNEIMLFAATWMDLESIRTKPEEKNKYMILLICGI